MSPLLEQGRIPDGNQQREIPYFKLHYFLSGFTDDKQFAKGAGDKGPFVDRPILQINRRTLKIRKNKGHVIIEPATSSKSPVADLRRLARAKGAYAWSKAWYELSPAAAKAILRPAGRGQDPVPSRLLIVPLRADIDPLIDRAIPKSRKSARRSLLRSPSVIAPLSRFCAPIVISLENVQPPSQRKRSFQR